MKTIACSLVLAVLLSSSNADAQNAAQETPDASANRQGVVGADRGHAFRVSGGAMFGDLADETRATGLSGFAPAIGVGHAWTHLRVLADASATIGSAGPSDIVLARVGPTFEAVAGRIFGGGGLRLGYLDAQLPNGESMRALGGGVVFHAGVDVLRFGDRSSVFAQAALSVDGLQQLRSDDFEIRILATRSDPWRGRLSGATFLAGYRFD